MFVDSKGRLGRLLIVDDDEAARFTLAWVFRTGPWEVTTAQSAREALRLADRHEYDLIILDYLMAEMNGIDAARKLRRISRAPILLCSAHLNEHRRQEAADEPAITRVLAKPVTPGKLRQTARQLLRGATSVPTSSPAHAQRKEGSCPVERPG